MGLKLDQALILAKKKLKEGSTVEAKRTYQNILTKFQGNKEGTAWDKCTIRQLK